MANRKVPVTDEQIVAAYQESRSGIRVARMLGVCDKTVYDVLKAAGVETTGLAEYQKRITKFNPEDVRRVLELRSAGLSATQIAKRYQCSVATVIGTFRRNNVTGFERPRLTAAESDEIKDLYSQGFTFKQIGERLGRTGGTVSRLLRSMRHIPRPVKSGATSPSWKGGRVSSHGYIYVYVSDDDPMASMRDKANRVAEHRLLMARGLGRCLEKSETVHHIDGNSANNSIGNLQLRQGRHGRGTVLACLDCGSHRIGPVAINSTEGNQ